MDNEHELVVGITHPYSTGDPDSLVFVVLKEAKRILDVKKGESWHLKVDPAHRRLIYEYIEPSKLEKADSTTREKVRVGRKPPNTDEAQGFPK